MTLAANKHVRGQREMCWKDMCISMLMMSSWRQAARKVMHLSNLEMVLLVDLHRTWPNGHVWALISRPDRGRPAQ
jgi:hypothetical protein